MGELQTEARRERERGEKSETDRNITVGRMKRKMPPNINRS